MKSYFTLIFCSLLLFCTKNNSQEIKTSNLSIQKEKNKHPDFADYWYNGTAEITSYKLSQARYGAFYEGIAVNIFVTEQFLPKKQVKADYQNKKNIPILKLNSTKKFTSGIYPYSIMTSTFSPIAQKQEAIKVSFSLQEWCGNTFVQLNNREQYNIKFYSYFESNSDRNISLEKYPLENDFWNQLRINPKNIKKGRYKVIPSMEFLALNHQKINAYDAEVNLIEKGDFMHFSIFYPTLKRKLSIKITTSFPFTIESWEEGFYSRGKNLVTTATKMKTIQSAYWAKNGVNNVEERKLLGLD